MSHAPITNKQIEEIHTLRWGNPKGKVSKHQHPLLTIDEIRRRVCRTTALVSEVCNGKIGLKVNVTPKIGSFAGYMAGEIDT